MKNLSTLLFTSFAVLSTFISLAQTINIHSIANSRMPIGDVGYTLDGIQMIDSRAKLLSQANFGPLGTYPKAISITDGYAASNSLAAIAGTSGIDLLFFGTFNKLEPSLIQFTNAELDSLYNWSLKGGKMLLGPSAVAPMFNYQPDILNSRWGFDITLAPITATFQPTSTGSSSSIFNGPFGTVSSANQGGGVQGYFNMVPANAIILANDLSGNPTLILDCHTLDLILADCDGITGLSGMSFGSVISNNNDKFWANIIAYMDQLQSPPVISQSWNTLSTGSYSSYQWYNNAVLIPGATSSSYSATQSGTYSVAVNLDCGCSNVTSSEMFLTVGLDEYSGVPNINVGPNPIKAGNLNFSGITEPVTVSFMNALGSVVDVVHLSSQAASYDVSKLARGIYSVQIQNEKGTVRVVKKLVKE